MRTAIQRYTSIARRINAIRTRMEDDDTAQHDANMRDAWDALIKLEEMLRKHFGEKIAAEIDCGCGEL